MWAIPARSRGRRPWVAARADRRPANCGGVSSRNPDILNLALHVRALCCELCKLGQGSRSVIVNAVLTGFAEASEKVVKLEKRGARRSGTTEAVQLSKPGAGILTGFVALLLFICLVERLYELFRTVDRGQALLMVLLVTVGVVVAFANMLNKFAPLVVLSVSGRGDRSHSSPGTRLSPLVAGSPRLATSQRTG